jgi:nicotinamidase-related amidase
MKITTTKPLPIPSFFDQQKVAEVWRVPYQQRATEAEQWAKLHNIQPAAKDQTRICLMVIDAQNTFCLPDFELFVAGQSGTGAVDDNVRLCQFIYRNLALITEIATTMDTHTAMQIFHPLFWINDAGEHPTPAATMISLEDIQKGVWRVNPAIAYSLAQGNYIALQQHALHYVKKLSDDGKYLLTVWPYHAMLGGIGHALVSAVEEALFFHNIARHSQTNFEIKGGNPLTENYSVLRPEVLEDHTGRAIAQKNTRFLRKLLDFDAVIIAGQAKSHCVAWTIDDLLTEIMTQDPSLAQKVYLLEDCTSPVVVPNVVDFTAQADAAFQRFAHAGMHIVKSDQPIETWTDLNTARLRKYNC